MPNTAICLMRGEKLTLKSDIDKKDLLNKKLKDTSKIQDRKLIKTSIYVSC